MTDPATRFCAVLPTYNRAHALRANLSRFLELNGLHQLIVVDDCSTDDTQAFLQSVVDPRLRVIRHETNAGSPAARRTGIEAADSAWILMLEDDCLVPRDYGTTLLQVANETGAAVVGAPWVHLSSEADLQAEVAHRRQSAVTSVGLHTGPGTFPHGNLMTPFLPALVLARRDIFDKATYESRYGGNAWREETAFTLSVIEAGERCALTPHTYSFQVHQYSGGQRRGRLAYEYWVARNNWLFLRRHRAILTRGGYVSSVVSEQLRFVGDRFWRLARPRLRRLMPAGRKP